MLLSNLPPGCTPEMISPRGRYPVQECHEFDCNEPANPDSAEGLFCTQHQVHHLNLQLAEAEKSEWAFSAAEKAAIEKERQHWITYWLLDGRGCAEVNG